MRHASDAFKLTRPFATTVLANRVSFWNRDTWGIALQPGMDEASLALVADAWSRTYRSDAVTFANSESPVTTANGVRVLPDRNATDLPQDRRVSTFPGRRPAEALDDTLQAITDRYGEPTTNVVSMQLEYPRWQIRTREKRFLDVGRHVTRSSQGQGAQQTGERPRARSSTSRVCGLAWSK